MPKNAGYKHKCKKLLKKARLIAFDFDGVFTDGKVFVDEKGIESVLCSRKDVLRLKELRARGIQLVVISREKNPVVAARCKKMRIPCYHGADEKVIVFKKVLKEADIAADKAAFVGDDLNDIDCLKHAGIAVTVADGAPQCKRIADCVTSRRGGDHAVREICDYILG